MAATTLRRGQVAIVGYNAEDTNNPDKDTISFVLLAPIGSGTQIFFTDRNWNGSAFNAASADENTFTYTAGSDLPAGTIITITTAQLNAAGIDLSDIGETIYVYQGAINAPTTFLFAADVGDNNTTFNGNLTGTGLLVADNTAVAIAQDNASWAGRGHNHNVIPMLDSIADPNDWVGNDNSLQVAPSGNYYNTPDQQLWVMGSGGGNAFMRFDRDGASVIAEEITHILQNTSNDGNGTTNTQRTWHPTDIQFDTVGGKVFVADSDGNGHNRILQYNISDFLNNPGVAPTAIILYQDNLVGTGIVGLQLDIPRGLIYYANDTRLYRIDYNTAAQTPEIVGHLGTNNFVQDFVLDLDVNGNGTAYLVNSSFQSVFGTDIVNKNFLYKVTGITPTSTTVAANGVQMEMDINDSEQGGVVSPNADPQAFPTEFGIIKGIDIDPETKVLFFTTAAWAADHDGVSGTPSQTQWGGVWSYATVSNPTGVYTNVWRQDGINASKGFMYYIEVDTVNNRFYFGDQTGNTNAADDQAIWVDDLAPGGAHPTMFSFAANIQGMGPLAMSIENAPTLAGSAAGGLAVTEASSAPNSGETAKVTLFTGLSAGDVDTPNTGDELTGAIIRISDNFVRETSTLPGHAVTQDFLRINNNLSGVIAGSNITYNYDQTTGQMTLTGAATVAEYAAAIALVQFSTSGDNVTNDGSATTRTVKASVFDGLLYSDEISAVVTVTGINDAPVNTPGAAMNFNEDTTGHVGAAGVPPTAPSNAITGISVADTDTDPATQDVTVTLSVGVGTITIRTDVVGGIAPADVISGNGTGTIVITATQDQINTTLAAMSPNFTGPPVVAPAPNGLIYTPPANFNGATNLSMVTNDNGFNGNDPGNSGTGTTEQDGPDNKAINVADVNDAPTIGDGTETSPTILEDQPLNQAAAPVAPTVATLFGGQFADAVDIQVSGGNPTGSVGDTFAGIAIVADGSAPATGQWEYWNGAAWTDIGAASQSAARTFTAATQIRFNPALNYNGAAPTLTVHLIETGGAAITNNGTVNLSPAGTATGGTTVYSAGTVVLSQAITAVNDAPVNAVGGALNISEDGAAANVTGVSISDVDANPATDLVTVTLDVDHGTLAILTNVGGGIVAGDIVSQDADTIQITATINKINATLAAPGGLTYLVDGDYNGGDTLELTTNDGGFTGQDPVPGTGGANNEEDVDSKTINIAAANDPVTTAAPVSISLAEDSVNFAVTGMSISDIDATLAPGGVYVVTLSSTQGTMTLSTLTGLTFSAGDGTGDATMTFRGTLADINTALATASYTPTAHYNGSAQIDLQATDTFGGTVATGTGAATNDSDSIAVTVTAVNDPVTTAAPATATVGEDSTDVAITGLSISDLDAALAPAGVYEVTLSSTQGTMKLTTLTGLTFTTGDGADDATMTFHGTLADINAALATASYSPADDYHGAAQIQLQATDTFGAIVATGTGVATNDSDTVAVTVDSVNDAPAGADNGASVIVTATHTFTVANFATGMTDPKDSPANAFAGVKITTLPAVGAGIIFYDADGGGVNPPTPIAAGDSFTAQDLIDGKLTYVPSPGTGGMTPSFTFQVRDDGGTTGGGVDLDPNPDTFTFTITTPQASPVINDLAGDTSTFTEGGSAVLLDDSSAPELAATVTDLDSADFNGGTLAVSITGNEVAAEDVLGISTGGTVTLSNGTNVGSVVSVGGQAIGTVSSNGTGGNDLAVALDTANATPANVSALVQALTYGNTNTDNPSTAQRTIAVTVSDGDGGSDSENVLVNVSATNDPPVVTIQDATVSGTEDTNLVFSTANGNGITVADLDATTLTMTLTVLSGALTLASTSGLTGVTGDGTATVEFTGSAADINNALDGLIYRGGLNYEGSDTLDVELDDGTATDTGSIAITLADDGIIHGDTTNNTLSGTANPDLFYVMQGGTEHLDGLGGNDAFLFGSTLDATDYVDGGAGAKDQLGIQGNYPAYTLGADNLLNIETLALLSGTDTRFGDPGTNLYDYNLTTVNENVASGALLTVNFNNLKAGEDVVFNGTAETDGAFLFFAGQGTDTLTGGSGNDGFFFGANSGGVGAFTAADKVDGGIGNLDQLGLRGNYTVTFLATTMVNIETLAMFSGADTKFGPPSPLFTYDITLDDANVGSGQQLSVNAAGLRAGENLTFDGSAEMDGSFFIRSGAGDDVLTGGKNADTIFGGLGFDTMTGGLGDDVFLYRFVEESTLAAPDKILDFTTGDDVVDLSLIDADTNTAGNQAFSFVGTAAFSNTAGELRYEADGLFWSVQGDTDGDGDADFEILLSIAGAPILTGGDFIP
jgi:hypothetical protein